MNVAVGGQSKWAHYASYGMGSSQYPALSTSFFIHYSHSHLGEMGEADRDTLHNDFIFLTNLPFDCFCYYLCL